MNLARAESELQRLGNGPDPNELRNAERDLYNAQNTYAQALASVEKMSQPDPIALAAAQRAVARLLGADGGELDASVDLLMDGDSGVGRTVQLSALWPEPAPPIGTVAQIIVTLREKNDVLLVPQKAIRTAGARRFVEVADGQNRTMTDVEEGIISNGQAEIVNGLKQDQLVLVNP